jgi:hypothetical protein
LQIAAQATMHLNLTCDTRKVFFPAPHACIRNWAHVT